MKPMNLEAANDLIERLRREAEQHAMEARTANASLAKCYQAVTGSTGEPGNWNGAKPVEEYVARTKASMERIGDTLVELNISNYGHDDVCRQNDSVVEVLLSLPSPPEGG